MKQKIDLDRIKEELEQMEDEIIQERKERMIKEGSLFSYWLYEIKVESSREENEMTEKEKIENYKQRLADVIKQNKINIEDTLNREICLMAVRGIHHAQNLRIYIEQNLSL